MSDQGQEIFIGRQPILDRTQNLVAYELLFRSGQKNAASVLDDHAATANVISYAFSEFGIEQALGEYKGFLNCDAAVLMSDLPDLLPASKIVLEILETVEVTPELVARCAELKKRGFTLALDDFISDTAKWAPLLSLVDIVKVDLLALAPNTLEATTLSLKRWPVKLLAEKVDSQEVAEHCLKLGYDYFQGYYFARPTIITGRKVGQSQMGLMQLMALIMEDAETEEIETALKQQPGLAMNLLKLTNSVATGARLKITSLRHAITVLGRRQLQRWLQLLLYTSQSSVKIPGPLMHLAATRGRMLELLAAKIKPGNRDFEDFAFLTGIMSLMPALMSVAIEEILQGITLDAQIVSALTSREGELGGLLKLVEQLEAGDLEAGQQSCANFKLDADMVNGCLTQALAWASNIGQEASV